MDPVLAMPSTQSLTPCKNLPNLRENRKYGWKNRNKTYLCGTECLAISQKSNFSVEHAV
jgi:hypothetical protein